LTGGCSSRHARPLAQHHGDHHLPQPAAADVDGAPRVFKQNAPQNNRQGQVIKVDFDKERMTSRTKLFSFVEDLTEKVKLEDADVIVAGGGDWRSRKTSG